MKAFNFFLLGLLTAAVAAIVIVRAREPKSPANFGIFNQANIPSAGDDFFNSMETPSDESLAPPRLKESLSYRISWANFATAATATISIPQRMYYYGINIWDLRATINTVNPVRAIFAIDDQFSSYARVTNLSSVRYEMNLREMGKDRLQTFRLAPGGSPVAGDGISINAPSGTCDPLSALFVIRAADWKRPVNIHVFDGKQIYELSAQKIGGESVSVPAGKFDADKIAIQLGSAAGNAPPLQLTIWLSQDATRTPVAIQATLPFGSLRASLTSGFSPQ